MLIGLLRRVAILFSGLAFLAGATVQALPPSALQPAAAAEVMADMSDCPHMGAQAMPGSHPSKPMPCTGITPDCVKWMGCIGSPNLPTPAGAVSAPVEHVHVAYLMMSSAGDGVSIEPDLLPPIVA